MTVEWLRRATTVGAPGSDLLVAYNRLWLREGWSTDNWRLAEAVLAHLEQRRELAATRFAPDPVQLVYGVGGQCRLRGSNETICRGYRICWNWCPTRYTRWRPPMPASPRRRPRVVDARQLELGLPDAP